MIKSIRTPILFLFLLMLIFTNGLIGYYTLDNTYTMLAAESTKGLSAVVEETNKLIKSRIETEITFLQEIASNPILEDESPWEEKVAYLDKKAADRGYIVFAKIELDGEITRYDLAKSKGNATGRAYFDLAKSGTPAVSDIIFSSVTKEPIIVVAVPIIRNGNIIGVLNGVLPQTGLNKIIEDFTYGETGAAFVLNREGLVMAHTNLPYVNNQANFSELVVSSSGLSLEELNSFWLTPTPIHTAFTDYSGQEKIFAISPISGTNWVLVASTEKTEIFREINILRSKLLIGLSIIIILGLFISLLFTNKLIKPLKEITLRIDQLAHGNYNQPLDAEYLTHKNEIGSLGNSFEYMRHQIQSSFDEITSINSQLEAKVKERTEALEKSNEELSASLFELKNTQAQLVETQKQLTMASLIQWIAHHMNTPLGNVISSLSFLKFNIEKEPALNVKSIENVLDMLERNARRLVTIIESLKKISMSDYNESNKNINLGQFIVENTQVLLDESINGKIDFDYDPDISISTNTTVLFQVISILVENAITHAYDEGYTKKVHFTITQDAQAAYIRIQDYGKGMDAALLDQLFKPFYEKLAGQNPGLGLQIAYHQVANQLNGKLYHEPTAIGSCFIIELPKT